MASATSSAGQFGVTGAAATDNSAFCDPTTVVMDTCKYGTFGFYGPTVKENDPTNGLETWVTHIQNKITGPTAQAAYPETETKSYPIDFERW